MENIINRQMGFLKNMKIMGHLFLAIMLLLSFNCSPKTPPAENTVVVSPGAGNSQQAAQNAGNSSQNVAGGAAQDVQNTPDALIRDLYKTHAKDNGKILDGKSRTLLDKYFDKPLADMIWKDLTTHKDEVGVIDFDLFYNAQDADIKKLNVDAAKVNGDKANVTVTFENFGKKQTIIYDLIQKKTDWKISDINYGDGSTLVKYFKDDAKNAVADTDGKEGNFEGTYQVGDTTATVKPIKMAFELKWAKGSGTIVFFFVGEGEDQFKYSSEDKGKGIDNFIFDDAALTTGKFIRGTDGKEMLVKKVN